LLIGAGSVVTESKTFAEQQSRGCAPARVLRTLDEKAAEMIANGASVYVRRWKRYAGVLNKIE
jgi:carbonic anhydrase/acetyltransferase-like protein (isoleucine patch superfamily)